MFLYFIFFIILEKQPINQYNIDKSYLQIHFLADIIGVATMNHFPDLEPSWPLLESDLAIDSDWSVLSVEYDYGGSAAIILQRIAKGNLKIKQYRICE